MIWRFEVGHVGADWISRVVEKAPGWLIVFFHPRAIWFWPFGFGVVVFALFVLAGDALSPRAQRWMLPSFAVYLVGLGVVIFFKELLHRRFNAQRVKQGKDAANLASEQVAGFVLVYVVWFAAFVVYNFCRGVL